MSESKSNYLVVEGVPGLTIAPGATPLTWLNYFDGKFLRAADLTLEQNAQRSLVALSNVAGGFGIVHGLDTSLVEDDTHIRVGAGQGIAADGKVLLLPSEISVDITALLEASGHGQANSGTALWLVSIAHAEYLCGEDQVFGKLCEDACVTSSDRAHRVEGVVLRVSPLVLTSAYPSSTVVTLGAKHLRSRVASAYFADDRQKPPSLISGAGLRSTVWCLGAELGAGEVPLGVLCQQSGTGKWFDAWTARRERIGRPPRSYWAQRMAMRPWSRFVAQVLQFQCQLSDLLREHFDEGNEPFDPCAEDRAAISKARSSIEELLKLWADAKVEEISALGKSSVSALDELRKLLGEATSGEDDVGDGKRLLIDGGIVELPPAGYLPVDPGAKLDVPEQVRRWMGPGVDLRFCVVDADDVPRELVGAQHNDRISLLAGIDDPAAAHQVDVLIPDGTLIIHEDPGLSFRAQLGMGSIQKVVNPNLGVEVGHNPEAAKPLFELDGDPEGLIDAIEDQVKTRLRGAARATPTVGGGGAFYLATCVQSHRQSKLETEALREFHKFPAEDVNKPQPATPDEPVEAIDHAAPPAVGEKEFEAKSRQAAVWMELRIDTDPFVLGTNSAEASVELRQTNGVGSTSQYRLSGRLTITARKQTQGVTSITGSFLGSELVDDQTRDAELQFLARRLDNGADKTLVIVQLVAPEANVSHTVYLIWDGRNLRSSGLWGLRLGSRTTFFVEDLERDEAVREQDDADRLAALQAVQAVANAFAEPEFALIAAEKLFPEEVSRIEIQAKRDWVMFHARHRRECEPKPPCRVIEDQRVYGVYTLPFKYEEDFRKVAGQLSKGVDPRLRFRQIGSVAFSATGTTLRTPSQTIEQFWAPFGINRKLGFVGVIPAGASQADGDSLHLGRAQELERIVETISPPIIGQPTQMLSFVPSSIAANDGAIIVLAVPNVAQTMTGCYDTFWADPARAAELRELVQSDRWDQVFGEQMIRQLGELRFEDEKLVGQQAVVTAWKQIEPDNIPAEVLCVFVSAPVPTVAHQAHRARLEAEFGLAQPLRESHLTVQTRARECDSLMLLIPAATRVVVHRAGPGTIELFQEAVKAGATRDKLLDLAQAKAVRELLLNPPTRVYDNRQLNDWPADFSTSVAWVLHADADLTSDKKQLADWALKLAKPPGEPPELAQAPRTLESGSTDLEIIVFG